MKHISLHSSTYKHLNMKNIIKKLLTVAIFYKIMGYVILPRERGSLSRCAFLTKNTIGQNDRGVFCQELIENTFIFPLHRKFWMTFASYFRESFIFSNKIAKLDSASKFELYPPLIISQWNSFSQTTFVTIDNRGSFN